MTPEERIAKHKDFLEARPSPPEAYALLKAAEN